MAIASSGEARTPAPPTRRAFRAVALIVLTGLLLVGLWLETRRGIGAHANGASAAPAPEPSAAAQDSTTRLRDVREGYRIDHPSSWTEVADGTRDAGSLHDHVFRITGRNAFSIGALRLQRPVSVSTLSDMRAVTDAILSSPSARLKVLDVRDVRVAGLPAIYYLYYFPAGRQHGVHAHYFIFDGTRMYTLVFQVVPAARFARYADQFDHVVASFTPLPQR